MMTILENCRRYSLERPDDWHKVPGLVGEYKGNANAVGFNLADGTSLNLSEKD